jgi:hypothetical protein
VRAPPLVMILETQSLHLSPPGLFRLSLVLAAISEIRLPPLSSVLYTVTIALAPPHLIFPMRSGTK